jgi:membrane protease YdiL (CAAX protease family)
MNPAESVADGTGTTPPPEATPPAAVSSEAVADAEPTGLFTVTVLRQLLLCVLGWMFAGMAVWILLLNPRPPDAAPAWSGWHGRDVLLCVAAAYCLRGMTQYVWAILLYQRELRGGPAVSPLTRNLGDASWQLLALLVTVTAFALAPYRLDADALGLTPVSLGWLAAGLALGLVGGPGLLLLAVLLGRWTNDPLRLESPQIDFLAPRGRAQPRTAVAGMLIVAVVLGPCVEEALFRGVVYPGLRNELGVWVAVPLSAVIFGLFHHQAGWAAMGFTTGIGVALALLVETSGSLAPAMVAHVLINSKLIAAYVRSFRAPVKPEVEAAGGA